MKDSKKLATVLSAFLARLSVSEISSIIDAKEDWEYAAMNLGNSSQLIAMQNFDNIVASAVDSLLDHDKEIVESIIEREFERV